MDHPSSALPAALRVAIVGLGNQGREHLRVCLDHPGLANVAIACDTHLSAGDWPDLPDGCDRESAVELIPDRIAAQASAAIVATPPSTYRKLLPELMRRKIHLLVEKPLGMDLNEAAELLAIARAEGVVLLPAVQRRFHETYAGVPAALGKMGHISEALLRIDLDKTPGSWRRNEGIGALFDLGFHALDLAREMFGDLRLISACLFDQQGSLCRNRSDTASDLLFRTESGTFLRVQIRGSASEKQEFFAAQSTTHRLEVSRSRLVLREGATVIQQTEQNPGWQAAMGAQLNAFVTACLNLPGDQAEKPGKFGLITMKLLEEAYANASTF